MIIICKHGQEPASRQTKQWVVTFPPSHAHLLAHLVSEAFLPITQVLPLFLSQFVSTVRTVSITMMVSLFLGSVLTVTLSPFGLIFAAHKLVKLIVVSLSFPLFLFPTVIFVSLPASMLLSLLLVTLRLTSSGQRWDCKCSLRMMEVVIRTFGTFLL